MLGVHSLYNWQEIPKPTLLNVKKTYDTSTKKKNKPMIQ